MRFEPIIELWILIPMAVMGLGLIIWQIFLIRKNKKDSITVFVRRIVMFILLICVAIGPSIPGGVSSPGVSNLDILFAVDTTASMGATDYNGEKLRIEGAKQDMRALAKMMQGAQMGIVTFDSKASIVLPFTNDQSTFDAAVQIIDREIYKTSKGSAIDKPLDAISQQLKNSKSISPEKKRILIYLGDGEQTSKDKVESFEDLAQYVDGGVVMGYGTSQGARMIRNSGISTNKSEYINTYDQALKRFIPAVSKTNEESLKKISDEIGVNYINRNNGGSVEEIYKAAKVQLSIDESKKVVHYVNIYWIFAIPLVVLLFMEWRKVILLMFDLHKIQRKNNV